MIKSKEIADNYFNKYSTLTRNTFRSLSIVGILLIFNWFFVVEENFKRLNSIEIIEKESQEIRFKLSEISRSSNDSTLRAERVELKVKLDSLERERDDYREISKKKLSEVNDWGTLLHFIFFITDDQENGATILNFLFLLFILRFLFVRKECIKYLARGLRIYKLESGLGINVYKDFDLSAPFWLAPIPQIKHRSVNPEEILLVMGWKFTHKKVTWLLISILSLIFILQLRLTSIAFLVNGRSNNLLFEISIVSTCLSAICFYYWFAPIKVEDHFNNEKNPNDFTRRDFIALSSLASLSFLLYTNISRLFYSNPRFTKKAERREFSYQQKSLNLLTNEKSQISHFINKVGYSLSFKNIGNFTDFESFKRNTEVSEKNISPIFDKNQISWHTEKYALQLIESSNFIQASELLLTSISKELENSKIPVRLLDLLAVLSLRKKLTQVWIRMIDVASSIDNSCLENRILKWNSEHWQNKVRMKEYYYFNGTKI